MDRAPSFPKSGAEHDADGVHIASSTGYVDGLSTILWISVPSACPHWHAVRWSLHRQRDRRHIGRWAMPRPPPSTNGVRTGFRAVRRLTRPRCSPSRCAIHTGCGWSDDKHVDKPHAPRRSGPHNPRWFFRHLRYAGCRDCLTRARHRASTDARACSGSRNRRAGHRARLTASTQAASWRVIHRDCG